MVYAHEGNSSDNAFTTYNGFPTRRFKAFKGTKARKAYQDKVWKESGGTRNVIFCKRKEVKAFFPNFFVKGNDVYASYEDYEMQQDYNAGMA